MIAYLGIRITAPKLSYIARLCTLQSLAALEGRRMPTSATLCGGLARQFNTGRSTPDVLDPKPYIM